LNGIFIPKNEWHSEINQKVNDKETKIEYGNSLIFLIPEWLISIAMSKLDKFSFLSK